MPSVTTKLLLLIMLLCNARREALAVTQPEFDCAARLLAYAKAESNLADSPLNKHGLPAVHDALQLGDCGQRRPTTGLGAVVTQRPTVPMDHTTMYVSTAGSDTSGTGAATAPFASIHRARDAMRSLRLPPEDNGRIQVAAGRYELGETLVLGPEDSGLTIECGTLANSSACQLSGGTLLELELAPLGAAQAAQAGLPVGVLKAMLPAAFRKPGARPVRALYEYVSADEPTKGARLAWAREPNGNVELDMQPTNHAAAMGSVGPLLPDDSNSLVSVITTPRRNNTVYPIFGQDFDPRIKVGWQWRHVGGTARRFGDDINFFNGSVVHGMRYNSTDGVAGPSHMPIKGFKGVENWTQAGAAGAIVHIFHPSFWGNWFFELESFDPENSTLMLGPGGFQEAHGGGIDSQPFFVEGVKEALDAKGEWWVDRATNEIYLLPNATTYDQEQSTATKMKVIAPMLKTLIDVRGHSAAGVTKHADSASNITLRGLTLAHSADTFLEPYVVPSPGDWSISRNGALFVNGAEDLSVESCTFVRLGGNGVFLSGKAWRTRVVDSEFHLIGDSAVATVGDLKENDGVSTDAYPLDTRIERCHMHEIGVTGKQTSALFSATSGRTVFKHNVAYNGPRAGINLNDAFIHGHHIIENCLFNWVRETQDHGPINTWNRASYMFRGKDGNLTNVPEWTHITGNLILNGPSGNQICKVKPHGPNVPCPGNHGNPGNTGSCGLFPTIDNDDGSAYFSAEGNVLIYGGAKNYLGHDKRWIRNLLIFPDKWSGNPAAQIWGGENHDFVGNEIIMGANASTYGYPDPVGIDGTRVGNGICSFNTTEGNEEAKKLIANMHSNTYWTQDGRWASSCRKMLPNGTLAPHQWTLQDLEKGTSTVAKASTLSKKELELKAKKLLMLKTTDGAATPDAALDPGSLPIAPTAGQGVISRWPPIVKTGTSGAGEWASVGNHRFNASLSYSIAGAVAPVLVRAQWRRSDAAPLDKAVFVRTAGGDVPVACRFAAEPSADSATFLITPVAGEMNYHIYYMPFSTCEYHGGTCRSHATVEYTRPGGNGSCANFTGVEGPHGHPAVAPVAAIEAVYQPRAPFESFEPMEMPMTAEEQADFLAAAPPGAKLLVVPEHREHPVRMLSQLPARWAEADTKHPTYKGIVQPGENFTFQLALYAPAEHVAVTDVSFTELVASGGHVQQQRRRQWQRRPAVIPGSALRCMNMGGVDFWGRGFRHSAVHVGSDEVRTLWVAAVVPASAPAGVYRGRATVTTAGGGPAVEVTIQLTVKGAVLSNGGDDDVTRGTRLHWFDSNVGTEMDTVPAPFTPLGITHQRDSTLITMLGKRVHIGHTGLPTRIEAQRTYGAPFRELLHAPVVFAAQGMPSAVPAIKFETATHMSVKWQSVTHTDYISLVIDGEIDCTGHMRFNASVSGKVKAVETAINLTVPSATANTHFAMGLGRKGGYLSSFLSGHPAPAKPVSWVVYDFSRRVTLDGVKVYIYGDGVHDPRHMYLQGAQPASGGGFVWGGSSIRPFVGSASNGTEGKPVPMSEMFSFASVTAQRWRWVIEDCHPSSITTVSHAMIAEIEFHEAGNKKDVYMLNSGSKTNSLVVSSSGDGTAKNPAWQSVDGVVRYKSFAYGYDAVLRKDMPDPPKPPGQPTNDTVATWRWDGMPNTGNGDNSVWLGSTAGGLRLSLIGDDPLWQAGVPYDSRATPDPPTSWYNNATGGMTVDCHGATTAFSGRHSLPAGGVISFAWSMLVTPVRPFNFTAHFKERWAQLGGPGGDYTQYKNASVTVINMHQGNQINPWINYPYLTNAAMKYAADTVQNLGMKFSVYNTMRELSDRCMELFPMISMNETLVPGDGGGADWLREHLREGFVAAWSDPIDTMHTYPKEQVPNPDLSEGARLQDAGVRVKALSRWNNYYTAGLRQIMRDYSAQGIYLDEIAYDRVTMLRARKVLGDSGMIDHHSDCGGFTKSPATNYMELYPFINRLWYGEGFDYDTPSPDYWLTEISGLPSGLSADMLRYPTMLHSHGMTRYHYRGMLFGSAFRYSAAGPFDPTAMWKLWDEFKIEESTMIGWWTDIEQGDGALPVKLSNNNFKATVYLQRGKQALIAIADWSPDLSNYTSSLSLQCNWTALGLSPTGTQLHVPMVPPFQLQNVGVFASNNSFEIAAVQGGLLVIVK